MSESPTTESLSTSQSAVGDIDIVADCDVDRDSVVEDADSVAD
jgi:hypothetical protein